MRTDFSVQRPLTIDVNPARLERVSHSSTSDELRVQGIRAVMRDLPRSQPDPHLPMTGQRAQADYQQIDAISDPAPQIQGFDVWV